MKDNFSTHSENYARYRPNYPSELFEFLYELVPQQLHAWDCGTGNGQVAYQLAQTFDRVFATDISQQQLEHALTAENIAYSVQPAEKTNFESGFFDLIVVAQAIHWFDFDKFYGEVKRTAKENAVLGVVGYGKLEITERIDSVISGFYEQVIGEFWDPERKYIDQNYRTIPFPFEEIQAPQLIHTKTWTFGELIGYLNTWSAVHHFIRQKNYNPMEQLEEELEPLWGKGEVRQVQFPMLLRVGRIKK